MVHVIYVLPIPLKTVHSHRPFWLTAGLCMSDWAHKLIQLQCCTRKKYTSSEKYLSGGKIQML